MINKRLISLMGNAKKYIAWHVIIQLVNLALNITAVIFMADIIQKASQGNILKEDILKLAIAIFVIIILRFRFNILMANMSYHASGRVKQTLREKMYSKLLTLGSRYKEKFSTSEIVQISMEGVDQLETYFGRYLPQFFYSMIAPIVLFCVLSTISVKSAVILLICVPLIPISIIAIVQIAKRILKKYWGSYSDLGEIFLEDVQGLTTLKIYKADEKKNEEMNIEAEKFRIATMNLLFMQLNSTTIMDIIAYGGAALGVIISVLEYMKGNINLAGTFTIIMLSAESAAGKYPIDAVKTMDKIARTIEQSIKYWKRFNRKEIQHNRDDLEGTIAYTTCVTAEHIEADAIVAYTHKGDSIRKLAGLGAGCPIFAITDDEKTYYQLGASFNVHPVLYTEGKSIEDTISHGIEILRNEGILEKGDTVVLAGGARILPDDTENKVIGGFVRL